MSTRQNRSAVLVLVRGCSCADIELVIATLEVEKVREAEMLREKIRHAEQAGETWLTSAEHALLESF